jgi:hypothetical protein
MSIFVVSILVQQSGAQTLERFDIVPRGAPTSAASVNPADGALPDRLASYSAFSPAEAESSSSLPAAPEPAGANPQREAVPWAAVWHQPPFSRIGVGADVSLLGIGIKAATPLNDHFDARALIDFLNYSTGRFEVEGFNINANIHMSSAAAAVDFYPWNSIWRVSGGVMLHNGNQATTAVNIVPGTGFTLGSSTYYSSTASPVTGSAVLGLHTVSPAPMVSFGFGRFVPHSNRHWSFPTEFGVVYIGAPSLTIKTGGAVCMDQAQTMCSDVSSTSNPVGAEFNSDLNARLAKWRQELAKVQFYPIFSYSVVYSFNIR